jgi:hypothetical protein
LLGLLFGPEDGGDVLIRDVELSPNYTHGLTSQMTILFIVSNPGNETQDSVTAAVYEAIRYTSTRERERERVREKEREKSYGQSFMILMP